MGSIRPGYIKNAARILMQYYEEEFTTDFETNKRLVEQYTDIRTKTVRNRVAGYMVRLVRQKIQDEEVEATQGGDEIVDDVDL
ncbi:MAG: 30S ribosomal protein S17e [Candidatus Thorarchaeota archaeon]